MVGPPVSSKLAVLLHADIVGSTELVRRNEADAHLLFRRVFQKFSGTITAHGGTTHEIRGDALVAEFSKVSDAIGAATAFQSSGSGTDTIEDQDVLPDVRIGIAMGEVVVADGTITGEGIVMAQRLEQICEPGGLCVQATAYETVPDRFGYEFVDAGEHRLKGFDSPIRVYSSTPLAKKADASKGRSAEQTISIAVLPFVNRSGDEEQEYFSDGITEDIITELSRFRNLLVCARHSSFVLKDSNLDVTSAGRELGVAYVVEGSVRKAGNRVRVSVQLANVESGAHLWAERYDRDLDDIFAVQDEMATAIVGQLGVSLRWEALESARERPTGNLTAYDNLLRSRAAFWQGENKTAFQYAQAAVASDPNYAQAQAWMALQYAYETYARSLGLRDGELSTGARVHAEKALRLDDRDPFVHMAASMAFGFTPEPDKHRGLRHSDISYAMNPHDFDVLYTRAYQLAWSERADEALVVLEQLEALNPLAGFMLGECYADAYFLLGQYEDCLNCYQGRGDPPNQVRVMMAASAAKLGRIDEARSMLEELRSRAGDYDIEGFARGNIALCVSDRDAENFREGFRLAGLDV